MVNSKEVLRQFDVAGPVEREEIIKGLVDRISIDEAECLARARHKFDILSHDRLPLEIRLIIFRYLDISDLWNCALFVSRRWSKLFLGCNEVAKDSLRQWFACLYDKDMPVQDTLELFSQSITKRFLRDTWRFQTR